MMFWLPNICQKRVKIRQNFAKRNQVLYRKLLMRQIDSPQGISWQMMFWLPNTSKTRQDSSKFGKTQSGTLRKALDKTNWFASRVFLVNDVLTSKYVKNMSKFIKIWQNTNRYSTESSRQDELIRLKGFACKWHFDHNISQKQVKIHQNFVKCNQVLRFLTFIVVKTSFASKTIEANQFVLSRAFRRVPDCFLQNLMNFGFWHF